MYQWPLQCRQQQNLYKTSQIKTKKLPYEHSVLFISFMHILHAIPLFLLYLLLQITNITSYSPLGFMSY